MLISDLLSSKLRQSFGLVRGAVTVAPADPSWTVVFHLLAAELLTHLPESVVALEHVGSTAVLGLPAKPILDIAVGVRDGDDPASVTRAMEEFGFLRRGDAEGDELDRNFGLELDDRVRLVNAHMVRYDGPLWWQYVAFRDRLRADSRARDEYAEIKLELTRQFSSDRKSYIAGKTAFVIDRR